MACELCLLERRINVYIDNEYFIIMDCDSCHVPMIVWKDHTMYVPEPDKQIMERSVIWNILYLKTIDKEIDLSKSRQRLRDIQWQLLVYRTTIGRVEDYSTKMVGKIKSISIEKKVRSNSTIIVMAGFAGLILSLFIAFLWEYIEESKSRRKGKLQG